MKRRFLALVLVAGPAVLAPAESSAADHYDAYDGDFVSSDNARHHDIVDIFTFPTADKKRLVMIMNTFNRANASSVFDDKLAYTFRVRTGKTPDQGNEYRFTCRFTEGADDGRQEAKCNAYRIVADASSPTGRKAKSVSVARVKTGTVAPVDAKSPDAMRVYAGRRADAFFGDAAGLGTMLVTRKLPDAFRGPVTNVGERNVTSITDDMTIVLEVDFAELFEETSTIFRVAAETAYPKQGR